MKQSSSTKQPKRVAHQDQKEVLSEIERKTERLASRTINAYKKASDTQDFLWWNK